MKYFKAVAEAEHFTRAAEALHISQPSLSKAISMLEAELGMPLFERSGRSVYLNKNGRVLLKYVNQVFSLLDDAMNELHDLHSFKIGDVRIASSAVFTDPSPLYRFQTKFFLSHPKIGLHTYIQSDAQIQAMLLNRKIDFGYSLKYCEHPEIESIELLKYRLGVVVSRKHRLAGRSSISLSELKDDAFLCNNTSAELTDSVYELCRRAGFSPNVIFEGESASLIGLAVSNGIGVAFVSEDRHIWQTKNYPWEDDLVFLHVDDDFCVRTVYLHQLKERYLSSAALEFRAGLLRETTGADA